MLYPYMLQGPGRLSIIFSFLPCKRVRQLSLFLAVFSVSLTFLFLICLLSFPSVTTVPPSLTLVGEIGSVYPSQHLWWQ
jgi:hypothetical protein